MKISSINDIDLSNYKLAYFVWDCTDDSDLSLDNVMALADAGKYHSELFIWLIPKEKRLQDCWWDDWNDTPARYNASWFYRYPEGTIFLKWSLWWELTMVKEF